MKNYFFTIVLLFGAGVANSQTNVGGPIFSNTNWGIAGSPYNVTADVQVAAGVSLSIAPGVQINFLGDYEILIKGTIIANGTGALPVNFSGNTFDRAMLMFRSTNLSNSQLSHLIFTGPKPGLQLADEAEFSEDQIKNSGVLTVNHVVFTNAAVRTKGYQTTAMLKIRNATANNSTIVGRYPRSEPIELDSSVINNCSVRSDDYNYGVTIRNSTVTNSQMRISCCGANMNIISSRLSGGNILEGNTADGPLNITDSELDNTPIGLPNAKVIVESSILKYNGGIAVWMGIGAVNCSQVTGHGSGTALSVTGSYWNGFGGNFTMKNTRLNQNEVGMVLSNINSITIDSCSFYG
ncbi:MAG TPA: hypothetical protein PL029_04275, partial [Bacteroidia bacterium]|nr:hypothetical protein [Bacteroidia bacterium]